jgi:hypothetical protein
LDNAETVTGELRFSRTPYFAPIDNQAFHVGFFNLWFDRALFEFDDNLSIDEDNLPKLQTEVATIYFGPIAWITAPGELFPEVWVGYAEEQSFGLPQIADDNPNPPDMSQAPEGPYLRERTGVAYPILMGLTPDETGYMMPPFAFELHPTKPWIEQADGDHYEETNSIGIDTVPIYLRHVGALLDNEAKKAAEK